MIIFVCLSHDFVLVDVSIASNHIVEIKTSSGLKNSNPSLIIDFSSLITYREIMSYDLFVFARIGNKGVQYLRKLKIQWRPFILWPFFTNANNQPKDPFFRTIFAPKNFLNANL